jgi:hypothetical protein
LLVVDVLMMMISSSSSSCLSSSTCKTGSYFSNSSSITTLELPNKVISSLITSSILFTSTGSMVTIISSFIGVAALY